MAWWGWVLIGIAVVAFGFVKTKLASGWLERRKKAREAEQEEE
jgi:hypothetical protein